VQTECLLYTSPKAGLIAFLEMERHSHCQNNSGNAVPRRSRWKRSLVSQSQSVEQKQFNTEKIGGVSIGCIANQIHYSCAHDV